MTLFFDVIKLESESLGNDLKFLSIFEDYYNVKTFSKLPKIKYKSINGKSWILNPAPLFNKSLADISYIVQYIKLAGRRDYALFKFYNKVSLDTTFYPNLNLVAISKNPLLTLSNNNINFKFEDIYFEAKIKRK